MRLPQINLETLSAWITAALVAGTSLFFMTRQDGIPVLQVLFAALAMASFMIAWQLSTCDWVHRQPALRRDLLLAGQLGCIVLIYWLVPFSYVAIFMTLWSALLPYRLSMRTCLLLSPIWSVPLWLVYGFHWEQTYAWVTALLFWAFNVFALVMVNATLKARQAEEEAMRLNRELQATQHLLAHASKASERTRIARNIHDLLGHHLTALTIHLQVAVRTCDPQHRETLEQCHSLAKLLLSDVREAVSDIREYGNLDIKSGLQALVDVTPRLNVVLDCADDVNIANVNQAEAILRCAQEGITNCLRHSQATQLDITLHRDGDAVVVSLQDNGGSRSSVQAGNGLLGMQERFRALGGDVDWHQNDTGFQLHARFSEVIA